MAKDPAFLFYTSDFVTGTMFMSNEQVGIYIRLLCAQHQQGGMIEKSVFNSLVGDMKIIKSKFIEVEDGFFNERLMEEIEKRSVKSSNLSANAKERWNKVKQLKCKSNAIASQKHIPTEDEDVNVIIDEIYSLYPSKCVVKNTSTGKSKKDKDKIKSLLKDVSKDFLISTIDRYSRECKAGGIYMKNFSTFLNNLPDYSNNSTDVKTFTKVNYKIDGETVTHNRRAYEDNLSMYGSDRVIFIKDVE